MMISEEVLEMTGSALFLIALYMTVNEAAATLRPARRP